MDRVLNLETLITKYYLAVKQVDTCTALIFDGEVAKNLPEIMNNMREAEHTLFKAVGIDYYADKL